MKTIQAMRPRITRDRAIEHFSSGSSAWIRRATLGPLRLLAEVYIPFSLVHVEVKTQSRSETIVLAVDAVGGALDPYRMEKDSTAQEIVSVQTRNVMESSLSKIQVSDSAVNHARRLIFNRGFFRVRELQILANCFSEGVYIPFWVGFFGTGSIARLSVMNALSGRVEGAKLRSLLNDWLCPGSMGINSEVVPQTL